jgi:hypothetical protein
MYANNDTIKWKLKELSQNGGALIFSLDEYYVQFTTDGSDDVYFEAVSHEFLDSVPESLTPQFKSMGFSLGPGTNYYKYVQVNNEAGYEKIAGECQKIFTELYMRDYNIPLAFEEVEF